MIDVKYRYAADDNGTVVDIESDNVIPSKEYVCLSCHNRLRPVLGQIVQKHYRHKVQCDSSIETYLHNLAKSMFVETYCSCVSSGVPYEVEYKVPLQCTYCDYGPCEVGSRLEKADLTRYFKEPFLEKRDGNLTPDILLRNGMDSLYVEIAMTHYLEEPKRSSGIRIIEISINDETDVDLVCSYLLSENDRRISTYNCRPSPHSSDFKEGCKEIKKFFILYPNGKSLVETIPIWKYEKLTSEGIYIEPYIDTSINLGADDYVNKISEVFRLGKFIKNCWFCTFHCLDYKHKLKFCKLLKIYIDIKTSNQAAECVRCRPIKSLPDCGLKQEAIDKQRQGTSIRKLQYKITHKAVPHIPVSEVYQPDQVKVYFYGISMKCNGCKSPLHLITFARFMQSPVNNNTLYFVDDSTASYRSDALSSVLVWIQSIPSIQPNGAKINVGGTLSIPCSKCHDVNSYYYNRLDAKQMFASYIFTHNYQILYNELF